MSMLVQNQPAVHLTYCLNIHPGETWDENFQAIRTHALKVRDRVAKGKPFGLGLRLSAAAAADLREPGRLGRFRDFLQAENLYVFTINGFPYGRFHGAPVKENVYRPDWQDARRSDYSMVLADILAVLLPEGVAGSISTVPCSYKQWIHSPRQVEAMVDNLAEVAAHLARIRQRSGRDICLALEPEPDCWIETTAEAVAFFAGPLVDHGRKHLKAAGLSPGAAEECLRRHLGVCLDTAHAAVEFEDPAYSLRQLQQAGVRIGKVQLSAALQLEPSEAALRRLAEFRDEVYLHQVKAKRPDGVLCSYRDLPEALAAAPRASPQTQFRVHFHVPLFCDRIQPLASTSTWLTSHFWSLLGNGVTSHAEIETYTFGVLPADLQTTNVTDSIVREYQWVLAHL